MQPQTVMNILFAALVCVGIYHFCMDLAKNIKAKAQERLATTRDLNKALEVLAKSHLTMEMRIAAEADRFNLSVLEFRKALDESAATQAKAMIGVMKACEAIAATTERHRDTVASLGKLLFGTQSPTEALMHPSEQDRDRLSAEVAYRAQGHTPLEAQALAEAEIDREASMPSL